MSNKRKHCELSPNLNTIDKLLRWGWNKKTFGYERFKFILQLKSTPSKNVSTFEAFPLKNIIFTYLEDQDVDSLSETCKEFYLSSYPIRFSNINSLSKTNIRKISELAYNTFFGEYAKWIYGRHFFTSSINSVIKFLYDESKNNIEFEIITKAMCTREGFQKLKQDFPEFAKNYKIRQVKLACEMMSENEEHLRVQYGNITTGDIVLSYRESYAVANLNLYHIVKKATDEDLEIKYKVKKLHSKKQNATWTVETYPRSSIYASGINGPLYRVMRPFKTSFTSKEMDCFEKATKICFKRRKRMLKTNCDASVSPSLKYSENYKFRGSYSINVLSNI